MLTLLKTMGIKILLTMMMASLHFPVVFSYVHLFINDNHSPCEEYAKTHLHKKDIECYLIHTLKPNEHIGFTPYSFNFFIPKYTVKASSGDYFFLIESLTPYFLRRGPPLFF